MPVDSEPRFVVVISSDVEWKVVNELVGECAHETAPFGDVMSVPIEVGPRTIKVPFVQGGWGKVSAAASAQWAIDTLHPDLLVNLGTCGGFEGVTTVGETVLVERTGIYDIYERMGSATEAIEARAATIDTSWINELPRGVRRGDVFSGDADIDVADAKRVQKEFGAVAADWESGAIAWVAARNRVPALILRGVSDVVGDTGSLTYGDIEHFEKETRAVMESLLTELPTYLARWNESI